MLKLYGTVAYIFLDVKKFTSFWQALKHAHKRKLVPLFRLTVYIITLVGVRPGVLSLVRSCLVGTEEDAGTRQRVMQQFKLLR